MASLFGPAACRSPHQTKKEGKKREKSEGTKKTAKSRESNLRTSPERAVLIAGMKFSLPNF